MPPPDRPRATIELPGSRHRLPVADDRDEADQPSVGRALADRLARLPGSHPSAWSASDRTDAEQRDPRRAGAGWSGRMAEIDDGWSGRMAEIDDGWVSPDADLDLAGDELADDSGAAGEQEVQVADGPHEEPSPAEDAELPDQRGDGSRVMPRRGGRRTAASAGWGELAGPMAHSPYRPWFSTDWAADPWFAAGPAARFSGSPGG
jgi:hypothetical protein